MIYELLLSKRETYYMQEYGGVHTVLLITCRMQRLRGYNGSLSVGTPKDGQWSL